MYTTHDCCYDSNPNPYGALHNASTAASTVFSTPAVIAASQYVLSGCLHPHSCDWRRSYRLRTDAASNLKLTRRLLRGELYIELGISFQLHAERKGGDHRDMKTSSSKPKQDLIRVLLLNGMIFCWTMIYQRGVCSNMKKGLIL